MEKRVNSWPLVCPVDGDGLRGISDGLVSESGRKYDVLWGVPVLVEGVTLEQTLPPPDHIIDELIAALRDLDAANFDTPDHLHGELQKLFSYRFAFEDPDMQTEADQFLHRVAATHENLQRSLTAADTPGPDCLPVNDNPSVALTTEFVVKSIRPAALFGINIRVRNAANSALSSDGAHPVRLSYHWVDSSGLASEGLRTPFLADLAPGRIVSLPVFIRAPEERGLFKLRIQAVHEDVQWLEGAIEFDVCVAEQESSVDDPEWTRSPQELEYMEDHRVAAELLNRWGQSLLGRPVERVLEIGGNANPMIAAVEARLKLNVDIDPYGMIVGNLIQRSSPAIEFVVADAMALPLPNESVDIIVMFATFHHFPHPTSLLSRLATFLTAEGLICLMCEPVGHVHRDTVPADYLKEIGKGVNEQSFALWEYRAMFDAADLEVAAAQIDGGSAKFALRRRDCPSRLRPAAEPL